MLHNKKSTEYHCYSDVLEAEQKQSKVKVKCNDVLTYSNVN